MKKTTLLVVAFSAVFGHGVAIAGDMTVPLKSMQAPGNNTAVLCSYDLLRPCDVFTGQGMTDLAVATGAVVGLTNHTKNLSVHYMVNGNLLCTWTFDANESFDQGDKIGCVMIDGRG